MRLLVRAGVEAQRLVLVVRLQFSHANRVQSAFCRTTSTAIAPLLVQHLFTQTAQAGKRSGM